MVFAIVFYFLPVVFSLKQVIVENFLKMGFMQSINLLNQFANLFTHFHIVKNL